MSKITNLATLIIGENLQSVRVTFNDGGKEYSYLSAHDLKVGDKAVVLGFNDVFKIVTVTAVQEDTDLELEPDYEYKFIHDKVDFTVHDQLVAARNDLKKGIVRAQRKKQMEAVKAELGVDNNLLDTLRAGFKALLPPSK